MPVKDVDTVKLNAMNKVRAKYEAGVKEHGGGLHEKPDALQMWVQNLQEEAIDTVFYCEKILKSANQLEWGVAAFFADNLAAGLIETSECGDTGQDGYWVHPSLRKVIDSMVRNYEREKFYDAAI